MTNQPDVPVSFHRGETALPFVPYQEGVTFQLLQVDLNNSLWVIRVRFEPGVTIQRHRHTGDVLAFTTAGAWQYLEYPDVNVTGSYLYEPSGSIHTLTYRTATLKLPTYGLPYAEQTSTWTTRIM